VPLVEGVYSVLLTDKKGLSLITPFTLHAGLIWQKSMMNIIGIGILFVIGKSRTAYSA
jgi:hypothetical protein